MRYYVLMSTELFDSRSFSTRYANGGPPTENGFHCTNCGKPEKHPARPGFRRALAPFGGDMAAYNRVAVVVDQALSAASDEAAPGHRDLPVAGCVGTMHASSEAALSIMRDVSPLHVLKGILQGADHRGARDESEEKHDLGMFGFTFELCVGAPP